MIARRSLLVAGLALACACKGSSSSPGATLDVGDAAALSLTSSAFADGAPVPKTFTCDGANVSPPLAWSGAAPSTKSFALVVEDPDAPSGTFTHWVLFDVPASTTSLAQGASTAGVGAAGKNDFGNAGWGGPCPPSGKLHHYLFHLLALDLGRTGLAAGASRSDLEHAITGHVIGKGDLTGTYAR